MGRYINFHSHHPDQSAQITLINSQPADFLHAKGCFYSCGIHPWSVNGNMTHDLEKLEKLVEAHHEILSVGECGLDFFHNSTNKDLQERVFMDQLQIAQKYNRPVILHIVKAEDRAQEIIRRSGINVPCIVHGFNKRSSVASQWIKKDFYLSFGAGIVNRKSAVARSLKIIPRDKFFLETDDENIPVSKLYEAAAGILGCKEETLIDQIELNFEKLFSGV